MNPNPRLGIIAAVAANGVIGNQGKLPWRSREEMKHFRSATMNRALVMGRKTFESIGKALPGRMSIVVSRSKLAGKLAGCEVRSSIAKAIEAARQRPGSMVWIAGGAEIYQQTIDKADTLLLSVFKDEFEGDAYFPEIDSSIWTLAESKTSRTKPTFEVKRYQRKSSPGPQTALH